MTEIVKKYDRDVQSGKELRAQVDRDEKDAARQLGGAVIRETRYLKDDSQFDVVVTWRLA